MKGICKLQDCPRKHKALGYCNLHYRRFKIHGDPNKVLVNHWMDDGEAALNYLIYTYKNNAKKRDLEWSLDKETVRKLTKDNCYYCLEPATKYYVKAHHSKGKYYYNGIDRLQPNLGYTVDNCVTCCTFCNFMKSDATPEEFFEKVKLIYEHHIKN